MSTETDKPAAVKLSENPDIPVLDGWVTLTEAGEMLGITRQHSYKRAQHDGYKSLHRIGNSSITVVSTTEVEELAEARRKRTAEREEKASE